MYWFLSRGAVCVYERVRLVDSIVILRFDFEGEIGSDTRFGDRCFLGFDGLVGQAQIIFMGQLREEGSNYTSFSADIPYFAFEPLEKTKSPCLLLLFHLLLDDIVKTIKV